MCTVSLITKVRFDQMTTFNVLPIVSWATVNFDWEQHMYGDGEPEMDCSKYGLEVCSKHWQVIPQQSTCSTTMCLL